MSLVKQAISVPMSLNWLTGSEIQRFFSMQTNKPFNPLNQSSLSKHKKTCAQRRFFKSSPSLLNREGVRDLNPAVPKHLGGGAVFGGREFASARHLFFAQLIP